MMGERCDPEEQLREARSPVNQTGANLTAFSFGEPVGTCAGLMPGARSFIGIDPFSAGIESGVELKIIRNIDVAPTIAPLMGLQLPEAEGRVLVDMLKAK